MLLLPPSHTAALLLHTIVDDAAESVRPVISVLIQGNAAERVQVPEPIVSVLVAVPVTLTLGVVTLYVLPARVPLVNLQTREIKILKF